MRDSLFTTLVFVVLCVLGAGNSVLLAQTTGLDKNKEFLMDRGIDIGKCRFEPVYGNDTLTLFSDRRNRTSLIVANDRFSEVLNGNTVLFWSKESAFLSTSVNISIRKYIDYWQAKIKELTNSQETRNREGSAVPYTPQKESVSPLLGDIRFDQGHPYNVLCPMRNGGKTLVGCVPVACSQIMAMYRYPEHGVGQFRYMLDNNKTQVSKDFSDVYPNWDYCLRHDIKNTDSLSIYYISTLLTAVSASLGADFGSDKTSAHFNNVKTAMVNFWQFSPEMRHIRDVGENTLLTLIHRELDNDRPVLVSDVGHCYVCDGCDGDYLHMNLGWNGRWNGYYRTINAQEKDNPLPLKYIIVNIKPDKKEKKELTLELKSANMLRKMLSDDDMRNVNKLTLSGVLGNDDINLLRQMLGASNTETFDWTGNLTELDISNTKFKTASKGWYKSVELHGNAGSTTRTRSDEYGNIVEKTVFNFNYDTMSDRDWQLYQERGMHERPGYKVVRENGKCKGCFFVTAGTIGASMFEDCTNLQSIKLPLKVHEISYKAFSGCTSLKNVGTHKNITTIGQSAFARCTLLQEVHVHKSSVSEFHLKAFLNSNPWVLFVYDL